MSSEDQTIVGYFCWVRSVKGAPIPEKISLQRYNDPLPETKQRFADVIVAQPIPLRHVDWDLPLDALARKYPFPVE